MRPVVEIISSQATPQLIVRKTTRRKNAYASLLISKTHPVQKVYAYSTRGRIILWCMMFTSPREGYSPQHDYC